MAVPEEKINQSEMNLSKKELKLLESFQYDKPLLRNSTVKISNSHNYYVDYFRNSMDQDLDSKKA